MKRHIVFAVNGSERGAMGIRARGLSRTLTGGNTVSFLYRPELSKLTAARQMRAQLAQLRPSIVYVLDMGLSGVLAALIYKAQSGARVVIDTGDAITALARSAQLRGPAGLAATWLLEEAGLRFADRLVVRGSKHRELLARRGLNATWIPDGFEADLFYPEMKRPRDGKLCVGLLGSITWNGKLEATYGWDLVETLALLPNEDLRGLVVGDGTGLNALREHAARRGVERRIKFTGRIPYEELRPWIQSMDICLSTQTNDLPGQVRTTGKLPLYMACGRFVLASRVGEAARVLPEEMLVDYDGSCDSAYPAKLASRLRSLMEAAVDFEAAGARLAREVAPEFEYGRLSTRLQEVLDSL